MRKMSSQDNLKNDFEDQSYVYATILSIINKKFWFNPETLIMEISYCAVIKESDDQPWLEMEQYMPFLRGTINAYESHQSQSIFDDIKNQLQEQHKENSPCFSHPSLPHKQNESQHVEYSLFDIKQNNFISARQDCHLSIKQDNLFSEVQSILLCDSNKQSEKDYFLKHNLKEFDKQKQFEDNNLSHNTSSILLETQNKQEGNPSDQKKLERDKKNNHQSKEMQTQQEQNQIIEQSISESQIIIYNDFLEGLKQQENKQSSQNNQDIQKEINNSQSAQQFNESDSLDSQSLQKEQQIVLNDNNQQTDEEVQIKDNIQFDKLNQQLIKNLNNKQDQNQQQQLKNVSQPINDQILQLDQKSSEQQIKSIRQYNRDLDQQLNKFNIRKYHEIQKNESYEENYNGRNPSKYLKIQNISQNQIERQNKIQKSSSSLAILTQTQDNYKILAQSQEIVVINVQNNQQNVAQNASQNINQMCEKDIKLQKLQSREISDLKSQNLSCNKREFIHTNILKSEGNKKEENNIIEQLEDDEKIEKEEKEWIQKFQQNKKRDQFQIISQKIDITDQSVIITKQTKAQNKVPKIFQKSNKFALITIKSSTSFDNNDTSQNQINVVPTIKVNQIDKKQYTKYGRFTTDKADLISNHKVDSNKIVNNQDIPQLNILNVTKFLYKVTWQKRHSGRIPYPSYFPYQEVRQIAPRLLLDYLQKMAYLQKQ